MADANLFDQAEHGEYATPIECLIASVRPQEGDDELVQPFDVLWEYPYRYSMPMLEQFMALSPRIAALDPGARVTDDYLKRLASARRDLTKGFVSGQKPDNRTRALLGLFCDDNDLPHAACSIGVSLIHPKRQGEPYGARLEIHMLVQSPWSRNPLHGYALAEGAAHLIGESTYPRDWFKRYDPDTSPVEFHVDGEAADERECKLMRVMAEGFIRYCGSFWLDGLRYLKDSDVFIDIDM